MTTTTFYEIKHDGDAKAGLMAWLDDGRTLQYVVETGQFHDNPALSDDLIQEQYNLYEEVDQSRAFELMISAEPFDPLSLGWLATRFAQQAQHRRFDPALLGLEQPMRAAHLGVEAFSRAGQSGHSLIDELPGIDWLSRFEAGDEIIPGVVRDTVATLLTKALVGEPSITSDLVACSERGELLGLEHRVKSPSSLARKVDMWFMARTVTASQLKPLEIVATIPDLVRYTLVANEHQKLLETAQDVAAGLVDRGHQILVTEHSYLPGNFYKGFKSVWQSPRGQRWELQFRSKLNLEYKDRAYPHYKASRDLARSVTERRESLRTTTRIYDALPAPVGLTRAPMLAGVAVRERVYLSPFGDDIDS